MQDYTSSNKIKENKYKILRMSLLLGSDDNREETLNNYEDAAREVDAMNDEIYLKDLEGKFYDTLKLEEEEEKLATLVDYIGGRVEQRISLLSDFSNVTGFDLTNLPPIKYYDKLDDYKERLKYIREYLDNTKQINILETEIKDAEDKLNKAYISKANSEEYNERNEETLLNKFKNIIKSNDKLKDITNDNIDERLNAMIDVVGESKKSLDIFMKSFKTLSGTNISDEEENEYLSYVNNAKEVYYANKEEEYLLKIYKLLLTKEIEYSKLITKRDNINDILYERLNLKKELNIETEDILSNLYDVIDRQYEDIKRQKETISDIDFLTNDVNLKKAKLAELEQDNQKVEILALLREFCIIDTYTDTESNTNEEVANTNDVTSKNMPDNTFENINYNSEPAFDFGEPSNEVSLDNTTNNIANSSNNSNEIQIGATGMFTNVVQEEQSLNQFATPDVSLPKEEVKNFKPNQVALVEDATAIDLDLVHAKANKVMERVGEMLGIKVRKEEIVNVTSDEINTSPNGEVKSNNFMENPLFNSEISEGSQQSVPVVPETKPANNSVDSETDSFWFSSDTPDALNELPDLAETNNNNFFANNDIPELNFPDLKVNFDNTEAS